MLLLKEISKEAEQKRTGRQKELLLKLYAIV
jgi:hypothetical protein